MSLVEVHEALIQLFHKRGNYQWLYNAITTQDQQIVMIVKEYYCLYF